MKRMIASAWVLAVILCATPVSAQTFSGTLETRMGGYWGETALAPLTQEVTGGVDGKVGSADAPSAQYLASVSLEYDPATNEIRIKPEEAWVKIFAGSFDFSLGNQIVAWSISDAVYPCDVVNPWDNSIPVDRAKMPSPLARVVLNGSFFSIDLVAQPYWVHGLLPESPWETPSQIALDPLTHEVASDKTPDFSWDNVGFGGHAKVSLELLQGLDIGLTYFRGVSSTPTGVVLSYTGPYPTGYYYTFDRSTLLGADLTLATGGDLLLKTEWGYTTLGDTDLFNPEAGKASAEGVSGFEYTIGTAQIEGEYVLDWTNGTSEGTYQHRVFGIFTWNIDDRSEIKLAGSYDFTGSGGTMLSAEGSYTIADGLQLACDMYAFFGDTTTIYGAYSKDDLARVTLTYSF
jgi:hypothetical protein